MTPRLALYHGIGLVLAAALIEPRTALATPKLVCPEPEVDLGRMKQFEQRDHEFILGNFGTTALEIKKVESSCVCTTPKRLRPDQRVIPPGKSIKIPVTFNSKEKFGIVNSQAIVHTNDPLNPEFRLRLRAYVETLARITPKNYFFSNLPRNKPGPQPVLILPGEPEQTLELVELTCPLEGVEILVEDHTDEKENRVGVAVGLRFDSNVPLGRVQTQLVGKVRVGSAEKEIKIPVTGTLVGNLIVQPLHLTNPLEAKRGVQLGAVTVRANRDVLVRATAAVPRDPFVVADLVETQPNKLYTINVSLAPDAPAGPLATTVDIYTDSLDQPVVTVPVLYNAEPLIKLSHPSLALGGSDERSRRATLTLTAADEAPLTVQSAEAADPDVQVNILPPGDKKHVVRVQVSLKPGAEPGEHNTRVTLKTNIPGADRLIVPVRAVVAQETRASAQ